ncbi:hypothetical protein FGIG_09776 [Fasciola gigantica]|uniref:Uncharacterized protein n=1 Tax=Fasciola gigantica TaxID=46835 RepID=A0A504YPG7_FASGI|nr:hypothetical protein FGIG_09776 [Fasciola gigantica]
MDRYGLYPPPKPRRELARSSHGIRSGQIFVFFRHLVPFRDALFALGWSWPEPNTFVRASDDFLNLIASYQYGSTARRRRWTSSASSEGGSLNDSVAELNLDEDTESSEATTKTAATGIVTDSMVSSEWSEKSQPYPVRGMVDTTAGLSGQSGYHAPGEVGARAVLPGRAPMAPLMPAHSESFSSPVMNGIDQVIDMSGTRMDQFKHLFRRRKPQWDGPQSPSGVTPNDWLKYTNWARESIQRRVQACVSWRLVFDAIYPSAAQMAQFELSWNRTDSRERNSDTSEDDSVGNHVHRVKSKPDITTSHRRFKCFVNHNPTTLSEKQLQGERTAQALHSAVAKLDIDTELDLDELDEPTDASHVLFNSAYPPIAPTEPNDGCMKNSNLTHRLNPTERMLNGDLVNGAVVCEYQKVGPRQTKHSDYNYSDDADSTDSGCLVTDTRFNRDFKSQGTSLPTSTSEKNLTPSRMNNHSLSNSSAVKSWYRLNFLESDSSDHVLEGESLNPAQLHTSNSTDELHEIDLSQQCPTSTPKNGRYHTEESMNLNHAEVRALLNASKNEDLEQFVQCLEDVHCASPKTAISKQRALSTDLQSYAIYFDHLLNGENDCKSPPRGPTHQYSHSVMVQKSFPHSEVNDPIQVFLRCYRKQTSTGSHEHGIVMHEKRFLCSFILSLTTKKPLVAANAGTSLNADATTNRRLSRSISHQTNKIADQFASTATHYLGALTRRHSAQEAEGLEKSNVLDDICPGIKHGSDYLNPTNIPNLGE